MRYDVLRTSEEIVATSSTSFRLSEHARQRLADRAERDGVTGTALLERLILEGVETLDHPGIVFRGPSHDRRAALAGGPDVWEVIARLRELKGGPEDRIAILAAETDLHARQIRIALEFASAHSEEVEARIIRNETAIAAGQRAAERRRVLLG